MDKQIKAITEAMTTNGDAIARFADLVSNSDFGAKVAELDRAIKAID